MIRAPRAEMRQRLPRDQDRAAHVDREMVVDLGCRDSRERAFPHDPGVVHEDVHAAESSHGIGDRRHDVAFGARGRT